MKELKSLAVLAGLAVGSTSFSQQVNYNSAYEDHSTREVRESIIAPRQVLSQVAVKLEPGLNPLAFGARYGLTYLETFRSDPNHHIFGTNRPAGETDSIAASFVGMSGVLQADPIEVSRLAQLAFVSNDPFFPILSSSVGQWHLNNTVTPGLDVNVIPAWNRDITGLNVLIGIVDDGLEATHPDLSPGFSLADSFNWPTGAQDPTPTVTSDRHGTAVAGVAGARGGNGLGVAGAAPLARLGGLRLSFGTSTSANFADAVKYRSSGAIRTYGVKNHSYGYTAPFIADSLSFVAAQESAASGTLHAFAAGNARGTTAQDSGKQSVLNQTGVIAVAALGSNGIYSDYSSFGPNVFITAPSSSSGLRGITTTDRVGSAGYNGTSDANYTNAFGGTSSASPLVAGLLALVKQVNPQAEARIVKHNLARTSRIVNATDNTVSSDGGWKTNAAGLVFNQNYGFGNPDANALTIATARYPRATPRVTFDSGNLSGGTIPDNTGAARIVDVNNPTNGKVEDVLLTVNATHARRGDLQIFVTSPSGTRSRFTYRSPSDASANMSWTFLGNAFWGEPASGQWRVEVFDVYTGNTGSLTNLRLQVNMGDRVGRQTVNGNVALGDFVGTVSSETVTVQVYQAGTSTVVASTTASLDGSGNFTWNPELVDGIYDVAVKGAHWLRRRINGVALAATGSVSQNFSLVNGDVDGDNSVTIFDYIDLSNDFDKAANEAANPGSDLDGDGTVTIFDYIVLSNTFDQVGD